MKDIVGWRLYALCLFGATVLLLVVRLYVLPAIDHRISLSLVGSLAQVVDSLIGGAGATAVISGLAYWLVRRASPDAQAMEIVRSSQIAQVVGDMANVSRTWSYRGHTGRYFRTAVLPKLLATAAHDGQFVDASVQILDPENIECVEFLVQYRAEMNPEKAGYWNERQAVAEIAATILSLAFARAKSSRFTAEIRLGSTVSPFTVDVAEQGGLTTREKANQDAFIYRRGSTLYDSLVEDVVLTGRQSRTILIVPARVREPSKASDIIETLNLLGLPKLAQSSDAELVLSLLERPVNPYGR